MIGCCFCSGTFTLIGGLPVAISAYARSGLLSIEHILIPKGLLRHGAGSSAALAAYGSLQSMALPVVLYPAAILSSFSALLIPEVTEQQATNNKKEIRYIASRVYQLTTLFSIGVAGIMLYLSGSLGRVLYKSDEVSYFIRMLAPLIPVMYMDTATDAMLKGLGEQVYSMRVNILDALVSVICVAIFVPICGINGYLITIYVTELLNAALSITRLLRVSGFRPKPFLLVFKPLIAVISAAYLTNLFFSPFSLHSETLALILKGAACAACYFLVLRLIGGWRREDSRWIVRSIGSRA